MKCMHCQGKMIKTVAPFHVDRKGYHLTLDVVLLWHNCDNCLSYCPAANLKNM